MKFAKVYSAQPEYLRGRVVDVEMDISRGLHSFSIVGMASKSVDEAKDRMSSALKNSGFGSPKSKNEKLVISLAPAELRKDGAYHDVAMAMGYLLATEEISFDPADKIFLGELSLDGSIRAINGILPIIQAVKEAGFSEVFVPYQNIEEAALISDITIYPVHNLRELIAHCNDFLEQKKLISPQTPTTINTDELTPITNFKDVKGQAIAKRGLEIAAAGGHNICMFGPPGTGKTMLARSFTSILPHLNHEQILETTGIHSISGILGGIDVMVEPPFRSPHHTSSYVAVVGGGTYPKPGEITLAHNGVLFLDEFPEFDKKVLESLRQPLEDNIVNISRSRGSITFPANFILVAAMNPCPCGFYGSEHTACRCTASDLARYQKKISGPIMDRIDIWLPVEHVDYNHLAGENAENTSEDSEDIKARVHMARNIGYKRLGNHRFNSSLSSSEIQKEYLSKEVLNLLNQSATAMKLSPRAYHRVIKLARTIADLEQSEHIESDHILEALQYRPQFK
ncbi:MAG: YifB family Mg chelatase-like AAA ATPase [Candidatus Pacebacteria bacterium]|nr:YifB family Mg chelatase-like AAA ATPase [Candidatus Paceibacterota bacterium]